MKGCVFDFVEICHFMEINPVYTLTHFRTMFHFYTFGVLVVLVGLEREHKMGQKCPNTEFFLVRIFPHLDCIRRDTLYLFIFSSNAGKYGPEKTPCLDTFREVTMD